MGSEVLMLNIPMANIAFGDRVRQDYKNVDTLASDIQRRGLIHPIAVLATPGAEKPYLLLAGGRRYLALALLSTPTIPCRVYEGELSTLDRKELELYENLQRENLTYAEQVALTKEIHELEVEKHGAALGPSPGQSMSDTAAMLGRSATQVSQDIALARAIEENPELAQLRNKHEAMKALKKQQQELLDKLQVATFAASQPTATTLLKQKIIDSYLVEDFFTGVQKLPDRTMNFVELDPPYGIEMDTSMKGGEITTKDYNEVDRATYPEFITHVARECYRVLLPNGWLIAWHSAQHHSAVKAALETVGFRVAPVMAVWVKLAAGMTHQPYLTLASQWEGFFYASKGSPQLMKGGVGNTFLYKPPDVARRIHPVERPLLLMQELVSLFCPPNGYMLIPFAGSGVTILAAHNLSMKAIGFDLSQVYKDAFAARVVSADLPFITL